MSKNSRVADIQIVLKNSRSWYMNKKYRKDNKIKKDQIQIGYSIAWRMWRISK